MKKVMKKILVYIPLLVLMLVLSSVIASAAETIKLNLVEETEEYLKFTWSDVPSKADTIKFMVGKDENSFEEYATVNKMVDYYLMAKPVPDEANRDSGFRYYKIVAYNGRTNVGESNVKTYDPTKLNLTPSVPEIEKTTLNEDGTISLMWKPFYYESGGALKPVIDLDRIQYECLVTRDITVLNLYSDIINNPNYVNLVDCVPEVYEDELYYYHMTFSVNRSVTATFNNSFKQYVFNTESLRKNTVYYIRLIAKMDSNTTTLKSDPSITAFYITDDGVFTVPAVIPKPPLKVKDTTISSVILNWNQKWTELTQVKYKDSEGITHMIDKSSVNWSNRLWVGTNVEGKKDIYLTEADALSHGYVLEELEIYDMASDENYEKNNHLPLAYSLDLMSSDPDFFIRTVQFGDDIGYEITHMLEVDVQDEMKDKGYTEETFLDKYVNVSSKLKWTEYDINNLSKDSEGKFTCEYTGGVTGLKSNTTYRIFIRAYRIENGEKVYATRPSSISATTKLDQEYVEPTPTVPTLIVVENADIYTKIKWRYNSELYYELKYGEIDDINKTESIIISNEMLNAPDAEINDGYYTYNLKELYPNTRYYVWINAKQVIGTIESAWSNPLTFRTTEILPNPITPPSGIGVASEKDAINDTHITVEWTRNEEDFILDEYTGEKILKNLSYICEVANNIKFFDSNTVECGGLDGNGGDTANFIIYNKNEFRAINLKSNSRYYVRIKTRITVRDTQGNRECFIESPWSIIKIFKTTSTDEYDSEYGDIDIPLTEKTETIYSGNTVRINILNDDRVINDMIEQKNYEYTFDFTNEKNTYKNREAYIPINVLETMQNRDMYIVMSSKDLTYRVSADAFKNMDFSNLSRQGGVTGLVLTLNDDNSIYTSSVVSKDIGAYFNTRYGDFATTYLEDYIEALFDTRTAVFTSKNKAKGIVYDSKTRTWKDAVDSYELGYNLILKTGKTGKVGLSY